MSKERHAVTVDDLLGWRSEHWAVFASSVGSGSRKRLEASIDGIYRVVSHGRVLYIGEIPEDAVREYNAAP